MPAKDSPLVITLWETYGSNMEDVADRVGEILGVPVYRQAFSSEDIEKYVTDRDTAGRAARLVRGRSAGAAPTEMNDQEIEATYHEIAQEFTATVLQQAEGGGVIMGRNGAHILRDRANTLHVRLDGIAEKRVERAAHHAGIPLERAASLQRIEDELRTETALRAFQWDPREIESYDAIINTSFQDTEETARFIVEMARVKAGLS